MEHKLKSVKTGVKIWYFLVLAFTLLCIVASFFNIEPGNTSQIFRRVGMIMMCITTTLYLLVTYKKPHGNSLKTIYYIYIIANLLTLNDTIHFVVTSGVSANGTIVCVLEIFVLLMAANMASRLDRLKLNIIIIIIAFVFELYIYISSIIMLGGSLGFFEIIFYATPIGLWCILGTAYRARYKEHKEAGLLNK